MSGPSLEILCGDSRKRLKECADGVFDCCVTSPPYFRLRDYGHKDQMGLEEHPDAYVAELVALFREVRRALRKDGTLWLNLGDCFTDSGRGPDSKSTLQGSRGNQTECRKVRTREKFKGLGRKNLIGIPWRVAFALQADGWILREDIIWSKPNCMPESVTDRCTRSHEYLFHFAKSLRYYHDGDAIKEPAIYDVDGSQTKARKARARPELKSSRTEARNGMQPAGFKDARKMDGKHADKQRGHSRRHNGFNDRWDRMSVQEQCSGVRNKRSVWTVSPAIYKAAHFATFPPALIRPCILAACRVGGVVCDPFAGSGTTGQVALELGRSAWLCELNPDYIELIRDRCRITPGLALATPPARNQETRERQEEIFA